MIKIGSDSIYDEKIRKKRKFGYSDVEYDADKWADARKYIPCDFDLLHLKCENREKTIGGWASGKNWDGLKLNPEDKVLYWKKNDAF